VITRSIPPEEVPIGHWKKFRELAIVGAVGVVGLLVIFVSHRSHLDLFFPAGIAMMALLAYFNGANDVSKAIATLAGSGVCNYRRAILYGSICTVMGAIASMILAAGLVSTFTTGLIAGSSHLTGQFALAALLGASLWVYLATRLALPVSTTHAITGAVVVTGAIAFGSDKVLWGNLESKILLPLLVSPLVALLLGRVLFRLINLLSALKLNYDWIHWLSSGAASFTRGLNDTPKVVALGAAFFLVGSSRVPATPVWLFVVVALAMGVGSVIGGLKVTETLAEKVTKMDHSEGFAANLTTALLVGTASPLSLPVSTTHISSCAIIGMGARNGSKSVQWWTVRNIVFAWLVTLPVAGVLGLLAYLLLDVSLS
jgi:inorganic phosphate transporter, PiT family